MVGGSSINSQRQHVSKRVEGPLFFQVRTYGGSRKGMPFLLCLIRYAPPNSHFVTPSFPFHPIQSTATTTADVIIIGVVGQEEQGVRRD